MSVAAYFNSDESSHISYGFSKNNRHRFPQSSPFLKGGARCQLPFPRLVNMALACLGLDAGSGRVGQAGQLAGNHENNWDKNFW